MSTALPMAHLTPEQLVSASIMRLTGSARNAFFAVLAMMAPVVITDQIGTAATDGERLLFNPSFLRSLTAAERDGVVVHEVLHAALLHVTRRDDRQPLPWNIACDIVVNGMVLSDDQLALPRGALRDPRLEHLPVEEVYEVLIRRGDSRRDDLNIRDLRPDLRGLTPGQARSAGGHAMVRPEPMDPQVRRQIEQRWQVAVARASVIGTRRGTLPTTVQRHFGRLLAPQVDWRTRLWQYMARTPDDFSGFDRRHLWDGLYLEELQEESVSVDVCVDTSGSITPELLDGFMSEVRGITNAYHRVIVRLFYCDAECHGPFPIPPGSSKLPPAIGGGGTSFRPFFEAVSANPAEHPVASRVLVYLTDGDGDFPEKDPGIPCLWVVTPGGLEERHFPFGDVVRMT
jgi:predicted metal-dependent peptidase